MTIFLAFFELWFQAHIFNFGQNIFTNTTRRSMLT